MVRAAEKADPHPVDGAFMQARMSQAFCDDTARTRVLTACMGLIKQRDDQIGRLMAFVEDQGIADDTMIIFTSDHGDYLGDHSLGEKELVHDASARGPLIIVAPSPEADATRGLKSPALVEATDVLPTILDFFWRRRGAAYPRRPRLAAEHARLTMIFDSRWKYIFAEGVRPMLLDLETDPDELAALSGDPAHAQVLVRLESMFFDRSRRNSQRQPWRGQGRYPDRIPQPERVARGAGSRSRDRPPRMTS